MHPHHTGTVTGRVMRTAGTEIMASSMTEKEAGPPGTEIGTGTTAEQTTETSAALTHPPLEGAKLCTIQTVQHHLSSGAALRSPTLRTRQLSGLCPALPAAGGVPCKVGHGHPLAGMACMRTVSAEVAHVAWQRERQELQQRGMGGDAPEAHGRRGRVGGDARARGQRAAGQQRAPP